MKKNQASATITTGLCRVIILLYGDEGNFPDVEHLFVRSFMTRAARGGLLAGPTVDRRLVVVVVRVAIVAFYLSLQNARINRPHRYEHYLRGRARTRATIPGGHARWTAVRRFFGGLKAGGGTRAGVVQVAPAPLVPSKTMANRGALPSAHLFRRGGGHSVNLTFPPPLRPVHSVVFGRRACYVYIGILYISI